MATAEHSELPVYQSTTVTYEQDSGWSNQYPLQQFGVTVRQAKCLHWILLLGGSFVLAAGIVMAVVGGLSSSYTDSGEPNGEKGGGVIVCVIGVLMMLLGGMLLIAYFKLVRRRAVCPCCTHKPIPLTAKDTTTNNGQACGVSAPPLSAQYNPQPTEESDKLMSADIGECHDETERMLDDDPRIVLKPLRQIDDY